MPGKTIITRCSDLILLKVREQYQKNLDFEASYFIQRHLRHAIELV